MRTWEAILENTGSCACIHTHLPDDKGQEECRRHAQCYLVPSGKVPCGCDELSCQLANHTWCESRDGKLGKEIDRIELRGM